MLRQNSTASSSRLPDRHAELAGEPRLRVQRADVLQRAHRRLVCARQVLVQRAVDELLSDAHFAAPHDLPDLVAQHAATMGVTDAVMYLADLQQQLLVPFLRGSAAFGEQPTALGVDSTVAGRAFQQVQVLTQDGGAAGSRVWLPLLDGSERLGVLAVTLHDLALLEENGGVLSKRLERFAALVAELVMTKTQYGDTIVRLRRTTEMGLAAEIQWSLLPPLTYADETVSVAGALEPAYEVAGDSLDYAVDWNAVLSHIDQGITEDFGIDTEAITAGSDPGGDVNRDGLPDILLGQHFGDPWIQPTPNRLYVNRGINDGVARES